MMAPTLTVLVMVASWFGGQAPGAEDAEARAEKILVAQEEAFARLKAVDIKFERRVRDRVFKSDDKIEGGVVRWLRSEDPKGARRMSLRIGAIGAEPAEGFILTGNK